MTFLLIIYKQTKNKYTLFDKVLNTIITIILKILFINTSSKTKKMLGADFKTIAY